MYICMKSQGRDIFPVDSDFQHITFFAICKTYFIIHSVRWFENLVSIWRCH